MTDITYQTTTIGIAEPKRLIVADCRLVHPFR